MIGASAARHLAEHGASVAVVGPTAPGGRYGDGPFSSHHDEGRITRVTARDAVWATLAARSMARYGDIERRSGIHFHRGAGLVSDTPFSETSARIAQGLGAPAELVSRAAVLARFGIALPGDQDGQVVWEPGPAGLVNPRSLVAAQTALAGLAGANVVDGQVQTIESVVGGWRVSGPWGQTTGRRLLLATGAYGTAMGGLSDNIALVRRLRTILIAELEDTTPSGAALPSLILDNPVHPSLDGIYWVPPVRYPDGRVCLKIGGDSVPAVTSDPSGFAEWFASEGDPNEAAALAATLEALLPGSDLRSVTTRPCVVTYSESGLPIVDNVPLGPAGHIATVALAGCGAAAKSCDEIGRLAASTALGADIGAPGADLGDIDLALLTAP
ncbi:MAG: sarcosine oxidase [Candidatus Poriferisodalaceae bacterium]|jgi:sarcosine oxidase